MWIWVSMFAAICWGLSYVSVEHVLKTSDKFSYLFFISFSNCLIYLSLALYNGKLHTLQPLLGNFKWLILIIAASVIGNFLTISAVQLKSATHAAAIEISYPIWCALFAYLLFGHFPITWKSAIGLIFIVVGTVIFVLNEK